MSESNSERRISITVFRKEELTERVPITQDMYLAGHVFASQRWAKAGDARRAYDFTQGTIPDYVSPDRAEAYTFHIEGERQRRILIGNGHHRTAEGILEGKPYAILVGADLGILPRELAENPPLSAQKLAVLGIEGMWPFKEFMKKFLEVRFDARK